MKGKIRKPDRQDESFRRVPCGEKVPSQHPDTQAYQCADWEQYTCDESNAMRAEPSRQAEQEPRTNQQQDALKCVATERRGDHRNRLKKIQLCIPDGVLPAGHLVY